MALPGCRHGGTPHAGILPPPLGQELAGEWLEDRDYRFRIALPGPGWTLLGEGSPALRRGFAIAALRGPSGLMGTVEVVRNPEADLALRARERMRRAAAGLQAVETAAEAEFNGQPAIRYRLESLRGPLARSATELLVARGDFVYTLSTSGWAGDHSTQRDRRAFLGAFAWLPGRPQVRARRPPPLDRRGNGWQVREGTWESAVHGLAVTPPAESPWSLLVGDELAQLAEGAAVGLSAPGLDAHLVLYLERSRVAGTSEPESTDRGCTLLGRPVTLEDSLFEGEGPPTELAVGRAQHAGLGIRLAVHYPTTNRGLVQTVLPAACQSVRRLSADRLASLRRELGRSGRWRDEISSGWSVRDGVFRDFRHGLSLRRPQQGFWTLEPGAGTSDSGAATSYRIRELATGLDATLAVVSGVRTSLGRDHAAAARRLRAEARIQPDRVRPESLGGLAALASVFRVEQEGELVATELISARVGDRSVRMVVRWPSLASRATALEALTLHRFGLASVKTADGKHVDRRFGFELSAPDPSWRPGRGSLVAEEHPSAASVGWSHAPSALLVYAERVAGLGVADEELAERLETVLSRLLERRLAAAPPSVEEREGKQWRRRELLAGEGSRAGGEIRTVRHGAALIAFVALGPPTEWGRLREMLRLLD